MLKTRSHSRERGQSLIEVALTLPLLLFIMSIVVDLGRIYFTLIALEDAANEAALYLTATNPWCRFENDTPPPNSIVGQNSAVRPPESCEDPNNAFYRARNSGVREVNWEIVRDQSRISFIGEAVGNNNNVSTSTYRADDDQITIGSTIEVRISYPFTFITPIIREIAQAVNEGEPYTLDVNATQLILNIDMR